MDALAKVIKDLEVETGTEYTPQETAYALELVSTGNKSSAARAAGASEVRAAQTGYEMSNDPEIQRLVDEIRRYSTSIITDDFIKAGLLREALGADNSRDRREALHLLGKHKRLFADVIEQTNTDRTDQEIVDAIRSEFGDAAADKAITELGE